jgi:hypothetical protein
VLYYDPDGSGDATQVKFAVLSKKIGLAASDFFVV